MNRRVALSSLVLGLVLLSGCSSNKPKAEAIMFWDLPQPVQKTFGERFPRAKLDTVERLTWKDGVTWYRLSFTFRGATREILLTAEGETPAAK